MSTKPGAIHNQRLLRSSFRGDDVGDPLHRRCFQEIELVDQHELAHGFLGIAEDFTVSPGITVGKKNRHEQSRFSCLLAAVQIVPVEQGLVALKSFLEQMSATLVVNAYSISDNVFYRRKAVLIAESGLSRRLIANSTSLSSRSPKLIAAGKHC